MQKKLSTKFNTIYDKNPPETRHRGNLPRHNKGHMWQTHSQPHSQWWKTVNISSKIRNKTRMSTLKIGRASCRESSSQNSTPIYDKNSPENGHRGNLPHIIKAVYGKPRTNIILNGEKLKTFPLRSGTRQGCPLATIIQHSFGSPSHSNQRRKRNKRNTNWKRRSKTVTVCRWHDTIHRES